MGHIPESTLFFVGLARLPQPSIVGEATLAVELEVDPVTGRILTADSTLPLPGLDRLLRETLVGERVDSARDALLVLEARYSAPFSSALHAAVDRALRRAKDVAPIPDAAPNGQPALVQV